MAHAVADDFFSAQSIHEKRRKKRERKMRELASHHAGSDNLVESDDDSDVFRNLDNEQMHSSDGEEAEDEPAALQERIEKQSHIGPNLEMIALEIDNAKWVPPKNSNSIRGTRGQHKSSKTQNQILEMLNAVETDEVRMELSTATKAGLIKPTEQNEGEDVLMLVMPLMLNQ